MALADVLRARAVLQDRAARIECGELGVLTVEALPVRELELLWRGEDAYRAVFYAACRDLQLAGEQLRREGKLYTPDGILQLVSDAEAKEAAKTVFALSGWKEPEEPAAETSAEQKASAEALESAQEPAIAVAEIAGQITGAETVPVESAENEATKLLQSTVVRLEAEESSSVRTEPKTGLYSREDVTLIAAEEVLPTELPSAKAVGNDIPAAIFLGEAARRTADERSSDAARQPTLLSAAEEPSAEPEVRQERARYREAARVDEAALADQVARRLLEGLRRANLVKGD